MAWRGFTTARLIRRLGGTSPYLLLAVGAILLVIGIWSSLDGRIAAEQENTTARALDRANAAARSFEQYAVRTLKAADNLTRMAIVALSYNSPAETISRALQTNIIDGEIFQSLNIQDADGNLVGSTVAGFPSLNYADRPYFQQVMAAPPNTLIIGAPVTSRLTGEPAIPVARRFNRPDGSVGGIVLVQVRTEAFERGYRELDLTGMDYAALVGLDGIVRAGSIGQQSMHGRDVSTSRVFLLQKETPAGSFSNLATSDGIFRYVAYRPVEGYPLFVAFGVDAETARADFLKRRSEFIGIGTLATALVLAFTAGIGLALRQRDDVNAQLRAREETLQVLATRDHLTGVPNRASLEASAEVLLDEARLGGTGACCIFIDLDNFGDINAALGHPMGDRVLKAIADALRPVAEENGHLARIGGDEFVVIFRTPSDGERVAAMTAERLRGAIDGVEMVDRVRVSIRASMGISLFPRDAETFVELVRRADEAMASSKRGRRGLPVMFSPDMEQLAEKRLTIRGGLADALANAELNVFYQPKVDLETGRAIGLEALVRWQHPVLGNISPADFIPVAEESGLIVPLGAWVLSRACRDCAELAAGGVATLPVAVNVSALQFRQADLVRVVANALDAAHLPAERLELELTESMIADEPEATVARLEALKALGVTLAIDDFGTGYSNLQYLRRFPVDVLKIDRSFVTDVPDNVHGSSIVLAILALARALDLRVVAEGVETFEQETFLRKNHCTAAQGYRYGRPMPMTELETWLRSNASARSTSSFPDPSMQEARCRSL